MSGNGDPQLLNLVGGEDEGALLQYVTLYHFYADEKAQGSAGLLTDQVSFIHAALDVHEVTGNVLYNYMAYEAAEYVLNFLEDTDNGGFYDLPVTPNAIGELARPKKDISDNANTALALIRLSGMGFSDPPRFRRAAERAMKVFAGEYGKWGHFASSYARAVEALLAPGLHVTIVGDRADERTEELQRTAWAHVAPGKMVEMLDAEAAAKRGLPADKDGKPYATVCIGTVCQAPVSDVAEMRAQMRGGR